MILEALNPNNNSLVGLSSDYYWNCGLIIEYSSFVRIANGATPSMNQKIFSNHVTNFLFEISLVVDSSYKNFFWKIL
jgi:hypothetical protein